MGPLRAKWEYLVRDLTGQMTGEGLQHELDLYGERGWELINLSTYGTAIFKRPCGELAE